MLVVLLLGFAFRIIFLNAPLQSDDTTYFMWASVLSKDLFINASYQAPFRLGLLVPLAGLQQILDYSLTSYYAYSISSSLFLLAMVYQAGFKVGDSLTALFSALLFSSSFIGLYQTTNLLPDVPNSALLFSSFLLFIFIDKIKGTKRILMLFFAALLAFSAYLIKAPNIVFLLSIPVYELLTRKSLKNTGLFSLIFIILWLGECCLYMMIADDFFLRIKMILKGTKDWATYMPELSWQEYLQQPLIHLSRTFSGSIILLGGLAGAIIAIWKKNRYIIALLAGALLLFVVYSYSVTSMSPLRRALPLNIRYIILFSATLTIVTGYALSSLKSSLEKIFSANIVAFVIAFIIMFLMAFQVKELPQKLPNTILFKDSSFFVADQLLKDNDHLLNLKGKVFAYPSKDFKMYPAFSQLDLKGLNPSDLTGDRYYLYSRKGIQLHLRYGGNNHDEKIIRKQQLLLLEKIPAWDYIINTKNIVLAYVSSFPSQLTEAMSLNGSYFLEHWGIPKKVVAKQAGNATSFHFDQRENHFYIYTFPGQFSRPPKDNDDVFDSLEPDKLYELKIQYRIQQNLQNLAINFSQYNDTKRIDYTFFDAPTTAGNHIWTNFIVTSHEYKKFRFFFRITNNIESNQLEIENISFNLISE